MCSTQPLHATRVLVAVSSAMHSELLAESIRRDRRFAVVGSASSSGDIHSLLRENCPDVLLISASMDEQPHGGLHLLRELRSTYPEIKAVVLLESAKRETVVQAFRLGARGVFSKNSPIKVLGKCINCVQQGQVWASSSELGFVLEALAAAPAVRPLVPSALNQLLSARELDVVTCLAEGLSNREIAQRLKLSRHTVKNYMFKIFDKLGVSSRVELLFYVLSRPVSENSHLKPGNGGNAVGRSAKELVLPMNGAGQRETEIEVDPPSERRKPKKRASRRPTSVDDESELLNLLGKLIVFNERADALASRTAGKDTSVNELQTTRNPSALLARRVSA